MKGINEAVDYIRRYIDTKPRIGLILGSGLGNLADEILNPVSISYKDIPNFPLSTVKGHKGQLVVGELNGREVIAMQGRFHYYEGYDFNEIVFPVFVMKELGVKDLIVTNAAGGMDSSFNPGDLMIITDHINMIGDTLLHDKKDSPTSLDMSNAYDKELVDLTISISKKLSIKIQQGTYVGISGPAYLTSSELIMMRNLGADAVGMSTVSEVIAARHLSLNVLGISCITDMAIGESLEPLSHEQVVEVANTTNPKFTKLIKSVLEGIE